MQLKSKALANVAQGFGLDKGLSKDIIGVFLFRKPLFQAKPLKER
jgi:hypothetical protein